MPYIIMNLKSIIEVGKGGGGGNCTSANFCLVLVVPRFIFALEYRRHLL